MMGGGRPRILWAIVQNAEERSGFVCGSALFSLPYILRASIWPRDLLFDVVEHHEKVLAFLGVADFRVGKGYDGTVILHYNGREFQRYP